MMIAVETPGERAVRKQLDRIAARTEKYQGITVTVSRADVAMLREVAHDEGLTSLSSLCRLALAHYLAAAGMPTLDPLASVSRRRSRS